MSSPSRSGAKCRRIALRSARGLEPGKKLFLNCLPTAIHDPAFRGDVPLEVAPEAQEMAALAGGAPLASMGMGAESNDYQRTTIEISPDAPAEVLEMLDALYSPSAAGYKNQWDRTIAAAEKFNEPGRFTAFIGYEWTSINNMDNPSNLHRVVIFKEDARKAGQVLEDDWQQKFEAYREAYPDLAPIDTPEALDAARGHPRMPRRDARRGDLVRGFDLRARR